MGNEASTGEMRNLYRILLGEPEEKMLRGRPGHRWESNSNETGCGAAVSICISC